MKTKTIVDEHGAPTHTILEGHHSVDEFNHAFAREGWDADGPFPADYISHEYWIKESKDVWRPSNKFDPKARPVTIASWDGPEEIDFLETDLKYH